MVKISQYPRNADGTPMDLEVGMLTDATGNGGARLVSVPVGPDSAPIDTKALLIIDKDGNLIDLSATTSAPMVVKTFSSIGTTNIPAGTDAIRTTGHTRQGMGGAIYLEDTTLDDTSVALFPRARIKSANGRFFRISHDWGLTIHQFGAQALGETNVNEGPIFIEAVNYLHVMAINGGAVNVYKGSTRLRVPAGHYFLNNSLIDFLHGLIFEGDGATRAPAPAYGCTLLRWADGTGGLRTQFPTTANTNDTGVAQHDAPGAVYIRDMCLQGGFAGTTNLAAIAINVRCATFLDNVLIRQWGGTGVRTWTGNVIGEGAFGGNTSCNTYRGVKVENSYIAFDTRGTDSNVITFINCEAYQCHKAGFVDENSAGCNTYIGCHAPYNGFTGATNTVPIITNVSYLGKVYAVKYGQEVWCATNAPSGDITSNAGWIYVGIGGVNNPSTPAWVNGMANLTWGGDYVMLPNCWNAVLIGCYQEGGGFAQALNSRRTLVFGGTGPADAFGFTGFTGQYDRLSFRGTGFLGLNSDAEAYYSGILASSLMNGDFGQIEWLMTGGLFVGCQGSSGFNVQLGFPGVGQPFVTAFTVDNDGMGIPKGKYGYRTGAGGTATAQATDKTTTVTLNKSCGAIPMNAANLAANTAVSFVFNSSMIEADDDVRVWVKSGFATANTYKARAEGNASGSRRIILENITAGALAEAVVLGFDVTKVVIS